MRKEGKLKWGKCISVRDQEAGLFMSTLTMHARMEVLHTPLNMYLCLTLTCTFTHAPQPARSTHSNLHLCLAPCPNTPPCTSA